MALRRMVLFFSALMLILASASAWGAGGSCRICGGRLGERYLKGGDGSLYCSSRCFEATLPACAVCSSPCRGNYLVWENAAFCSEKCLAQAKPRCSVCNRNFARGKVTFTVYGNQNLCLDCAALPQCFACGTPCRGYKLPDNRTMCATCAKTSIGDQERAQKLFDEIRADLAKEFGMPNDHKVILRLVGMEELEKAFDGKRHSNGQLRGYYRYSFSYLKDKNRTRVVGDRCEIFILNYLPLQFMRDTMAHELTHDFIRHQVGMVDNAALEEGFCEAVVADYNIRLGLDNFNLSRNLAQDPVYGDGYRLIRSYVENYGWPAALEELRKYSRPVDSEI